MSQFDHKAQEHLRRWRLALGKYAKNSLGGASLSQDDLRLNKTLDYLYNREYQRRGLKSDNEQSSPLQAGSGPSTYQAINWLNQTRKLFPQSTFERMQNQAIERYEITSLLNSPDAIRALEPNQNVAKLLMNLRGRLNPEVQAAMRELIDKVVQDILQKIRSAFMNSFSGQRNRFRRSNIASSQNFDYLATIRANLKNYDVDNQRLVLSNPIFNSRQRKQLPWEVVLCVDQSASMDSSIMYAAVCASILAALPSVKVRLIVFDTQVVDLSHMAHDPVEILMTVQLGGGTNIAKATQYCEELITTPHRTIFTLISDFCEGGSVNQLLNTVARMNESRVKLLGLAALNHDAVPQYDMQTAQQLANRGMNVAALTPEHFADWLAQAMQ